MFENERKFWLKDGQHEQLCSTIAEQFGALDHHDQSDEIFVSPGKTLAGHKRGEPLMRLRREDERWIFTYKRTITSGNRKEFETDVTGPEAIAAILGELSWTSAISYQKKRLERHGPLFTYALDTVIELPTKYLEIEYITEHEDPEAESKIFAEARRLGINPEEQVEYRNYPALVLGAREK